MLDPLDGFNRPTPRSPYAYRQVAMYNFGLLGIYVVLGALSRDFGWLGAGLLTFAQGGLSFLIGIIMIIANNREYGVPILLFSLASLLIGVALCGVGLAGLNYREF